MREKIERRKKFAEKSKNDQQKGLRSVMAKMSESLQAHSYVRTLDGKSELI